MPIPYRNIGPVDHTVIPDLKKLKDKSVIITGGTWNAHDIVHRSSGLGLAYVKAFLAAGANVTNADIVPVADEAVKSYTGYQFLKCDVRIWVEQLAVFKAAKAKSPHGRVDIVVANAGIARVDPVLAIDTNPDEPAEPDLSILNINLLGVTYTCKLAMHYFHHQHREYQEQQNLSKEDILLQDLKPLPQPDNCLILKSSLAGYLDVPGVPQYQASKYGVRGLMRSLRGVNYLRVSVVAPWFIATPILSEQAISSLTKRFQDAGLDWALVEDAVKGVFRIAADEGINGRALGIVPRVLVAEGYVDLDEDDCKEEGLLGRLQFGALVADHRTEKNKV